MTRATLSPLLGCVQRTLEAARCRELDDRQLLRRYATGRDQSAFETLLRRHGPRVLAVCRRSLRDPLDVEDAFQATFLILIDKIPSVQWEASLGGWLHLVARRAAARVRQRRQRLQTADLGSEPAADGDLSWREAVGVLNEELDRLPTKFRSPLRLCYLDGLSRDEAAARLGWTAGMVKGRLERGREALKKRLLRRGVALSAGLLAALTGEAQAVSTTLIRNTIRAAEAGSSPAVAAVVHGVTGIFPSSAKMIAGLVAAIALLVGVAAMKWPAAASRPADPPAAKGAESPQSAAPPTISGRVVALGKPIAGASVRFWTKTEKQEGNAVTTKEDGTFRLNISQAALAGGKLVASARGFGVDWLEASALGKGDVTLTLPPDDSPIAGRVLDLQGKPVANVAVEITRVGKEPAGDLSAWIEKNVKMRAEGHYLNEDGLTRLAPAAAGQTTKATTDADGRFRLTGFGRDRALALRFTGAKIESRFLWAITRPGPADGFVKRRGDYDVVAATFDVILGPTKEITGTVRDRRTGKPVAGMLVEDGHSGTAKATTDVEGRYRLTGIPKKSHYAVSVGGRPGVPYFDATQMNIEDTAGFSPVTVDFEVERGVEFTGRVVDHAGKPVRGEVNYEPMPDNPNLKDFRTLGPLRIIVSSWHNIGPDGRFTTLVIPGPGILTVCAEPAERYAYVDKDRIYREFKIPSRPVAPMHGLVSINAMSDDAKSLTCEVVLQSARQIKGMLRDPDNRPLPGVHAAGLEPPDDSAMLMSQMRKPQPVPPLKATEFTVCGLSPDRSHTVVFIHGERKLGKIVTLGPEDKGPMDVKLEPLAAVTGQLLDAAGKPWPGVRVAATISRNVFDFKGLPNELIHFEGTWSQLINHEAKTDPDGRFKVEGLLPGIKYTVTGYLEEDKIAMHHDKMVLRASELKDLGTTTSTLKP
ncbi:MAG: sigma-70 family RNA polymerase sigma factor [Gemmataceae bacterium]